MLWPHHPRAGTTTAPQNLRVWGQTTLGKGGNNPALTTQAGIVVNGGGVSVKGASVFKDNVVFEKSIEVCRHIIGRF